MLVGPSFEFSLLSCELSSWERQSSHLCKNLTQQVQLRDLDLQVKRKKKRKKESTEWTALHSFCPLKVLSFNEGSSTWPPEQNSHSKEDSLSDSTLSAECLSLSNKLTPTRTARGRRRTSRLTHTPTFFLAVCFVAFVFPSPSFVFVFAFCLFAQSLFTPTLIELEPTLKAFAQLRLMSNAIQGSSVLSYASRSQASSPRALHCHMQRREREREEKLSKSIVQQPTEQFDVWRARWWREIKEKEKEEAGEERKRKENEAQETKWAGKVKLKGKSLPCKYSTIRQFHYSTILQWPSHSMQGIPNSPALTAYVCAPNTRVKN